MGTAYVKLAPMAPPPPASFLKAPVVADAEQARTKRSCGGRRESLEPGLCGRVALGHAWFRKKTSPDTKPRLVGGWEHALAEVV